MMMVGQRDMEQLFPFASAVDFGGLIQLAVDAGQGGQIDDGAPAYLLPDAGENVDGSVKARILEQWRALSAEEDDDVVEQAGGHAEIGQHAADDDEGNEVRKIGDGLNCVLKGLMPDLVDQQSKQNGGWESENHIVGREKQGVSDQSWKVDVREEALKVVQADPVAARNAQSWCIVLKCDDRAVHGSVAEENIESENREH